jgi:hypothetical protein
MDQNEELASVIRELCQDFPTEFLFSPVEDEEDAEAVPRKFVGLKQFGDNRGLRMLDAGYDPKRDQELHVPAENFGEFTPPAERDELTMDGDTFKVTEAIGIPNQTSPKFYKFTLKRQADNGDDDE